MLDHLLIGLLGCAVMIGFFLRKGRKNDLVSIAAVIVGVVAVMFVSMHWDAVAHLFPLSSPVRAAATIMQHQQAHPSHIVPVATHAAHATITAVRQGAAQPLANQINPVLAIFGSIGIALLLGLVVVVFTVFVLLLRRRTALSRIWQVCPECLEDKEVQVYRWRYGAARVSGRLCQECATARSAVSVPTS